MVDQFHIRRFEFGDGLGQVKVPGHLNDRVQSLKSTKITEVTAGVDPYGAGIHHADRIRVNVSNTQHRWMTTVEMISKQVLEQFLTKSPPTNQDNLEFSILLIIQPLANH